MAVYYVATTGNDSNAGTQAAPWLTLQYAQGRLAAGDTLHVAAGTYDQTNSSTYHMWYIHSSASGTSSARTTIISDTIGGAKVTTSVASTSLQVIYNEANYLDLIGFEVTTTYANNTVGIQNNASNVRIMQCTVHDIVGSGAGSNGGSGILHGSYTATGNEVHRNLVYNIGVGTGSIYIQGIYHACAGGVIDNNIVSNVVANGIQLWHAATGVTITNNLCFNNGLAGVTVGAGDAPGGVTCQNCVVNNNIVRNNGTYGFRENGTVGTGANANVFNNNCAFQNTTAVSSLISGTASGTVTTDPLQVNYQANGTGNYHLTSSSPCKDTGTATGAPAIDYDGVTRPQGAGYDIGPYEYVSPASLASGGFALGANGTGVASFNYFRVAKYPDPALSLASVGRAGSSFVGWDAVLPSSATTLGVDTSLRGDGTDWSDVSSLNGGAIPGIFVQPDPVIDTFTVDSSATYTSTFRTGGTAATWVMNTAKSRLEASAGTNGIFTYNGFVDDDIDLLAILDGADAGGLVWRFVDQSNFYLLTIADNLSSVGSPNTITLYKVAANVQTQLGVASIAFTRTMFHQLRVTMLRGAISVSYDGQLLISYTDTSPLAVGNVGIYNNGGTFGARYYSLWMQPQGDDVSGVVDPTKAYVYTRQRLATSDTTLTPQVLDLTLFVGGTNVGAGATLPKATYQNTFCNKNYDDLVKQSNNYYWTIGDTKGLVFKQRTAVPAPWVLQSSSLAPVDLEAGKDDMPQVEMANDVYRNRQTLTGVVGIGTFSNSFIGNSKDTSFPLSYPIAPGTTPTITLNGNSQKVGLKGQSGAQWYYAPGDITIAQDSAGTLLTGTDTLIVYPYQGTFDTTVTVNDVPGQQALALISQDSGIVEAVEDVSSRNMDVPTATAYGYSLLARYSNPSGRTIIFTTYRNGLVEGQLLSVFLPEYNAWDSQFLIQEIESTMQTQPGVTVLWRYVCTASEIAYTGSWAKLFASGLL